ncbi:MAG: SDR family oxidoreductase [Acidimicrobiia bacterium]|nr:SDR family oxidoreductase [Acidimicrobiia bacterium]
MGERLAGKVAVITGGASGMGRATVERFLDEGARVVVGDLNADNGAALLADLEAAGHGDAVRFTRTDVSVEEDVTAMVGLAVDAFGRLDVMFNNAGLGGAIGPITEIDVDAWDFTFAVLVRGVFLGTKHATRVFKDQGEGGSIINTASVAGLGGGAGPQAYSAAKAAVVNLSVTTAAELAPARIRVNAICPGMIFTPLMHLGDEEDAERVMREFQPWPERGEGTDIAATALFLASDESAFVTGQTIAVDGGLLAMGPRINGQLKNGRNLHRVAGVTYGTTGRPAQVRRL